MVFNDFSARDGQKPEMDSGFGPQKAKHFLNAMSEVVTTANEVLPVINQLRAISFVVLIIFLVDTKFIPSPKKTVAKHQIVVVKKETYAPD